MKKNQDCLYDSWFSLTEEEREERRQLIKEREEEIKKVNRFNEDLNIKKQVLKHNMKCALFEEVIPVLIEILDKYENKPIGEKTKDKIYEEFKQRTGCGMYFKEYPCSDYICFYPLTDGFRKFYDLDITLYFKFKVDEKINNEIFVENRLKKIEIENIYCKFNKDSYIEDIKKYIRDYKKLYNNVLKAQTKLKEELKSYDKLLIEGLEELDANSNMRNKY